jgi:hypothetical protein
LIVVNLRFFVALIGCAHALSAAGGTLTGHLRDENWFAQYGAVPGVGYYEFAINANGSNLVTTGGADDTDVFGAFQMDNLPGGNYTVASWDVWWRSSYLFNVPVPASGSTADLDLRLRSTMWGYPAFWDTTGYFEFGQTFVASGPVTMIYVRAPFSTLYTLTIRTNGPGSGRVPGSPDRTFSGAGDHRVIYGYGEMPTVAGQTYYVRIRTSSPTTGGVIMQMDPRPDFSDPMPGGCLWMGDGVNMVPYPDRDLGLIIMSDDDGIITDMYTRQNGGTISGTSVGQTFTARGVSLISAAFWLADPSYPVYVVRLLSGGPGGAQIGTTKRGRVARSGDPEMIVTWSPGECPLVPGETYYLEVTRDGGGAFYSVMVNTSNPFSYGNAYSNTVALAGTDLAGTIMEEESAGSATRPSVKMTSGPFVSESARGTNRIFIYWYTDVPSDSTIEYAVDTPPYTLRSTDQRLVTTHSVTLTNLQPHTMYHYRVSSSATNMRPAVSRDFVICTKPAASNLLANPGFEEGSGTSPRTTFPGWTKTSGIDMRTSSNNWFFSMPARTGNWFLQGAVNGSSSDGAIFQRVSGVIPGEDYTFSAWITTWPRENSTWKYDVWNSQTRLIYMRLGIDPTGGTNASASTVQWTPRTYSHRRYNQLARTAVAQSTNLTVFVSMKGEGVEWHLYGIDDCALSHENVPTRFGSANVSNGVFEATITSKANRTNTVDVSTNLANWATVTNFFNASGSWQFRDSPTTGSAKFYRAVAR